MAELALSSPCSGRRRALSASPARPWPCPWPARRQGGEAMRTEEARCPASGIGLARTKGSCLAPLPSPLKAAGCALAIAFFGRMCDPLPPLPATQALHVHGGASLVACIVVHCRHGRSIHQHQDTFWRLCPCVHLRPQPAPSVCAFSPVLPLEECLLWMPAIPAMPIRRQAFPLPFLLASGMLKKATMAGQLFTTEQKTM